MQRQRLLILESYPTFWMGLFLFSGFFLNLGGFPLFDVDEGAFSEATREMLESGNWSATYLNGEPRYDKPIFTYWMQALASLTFGHSEWALRLHSAIAALLWAFAIYKFTRELCDKASATFAVLIFSTTFWITLIGKAATADSIFNLFICLTLLDIYRYSVSKQPLIVLRVWFWMSLGLLTKGPVAILIPVLVSLPFYLSIGQWHLWRQAAFTLSGWALMLATVSPWLYFVWQDQGLGFFEGFILDHNLNRFSNTREGHGGVWYYYLVAIPVLTLPYTGLLLAMMRRGRKLSLDPLDRFMVLWFSVVFVLVSLSETQLPHYVLYGFTPLIILMARHRGANSQQLWLLPAQFALYALVVTLVLLVHFADLTFNNPYEMAIYQSAQKYIDISFVLALICSVAITLLISMSKAATIEKLVLSGLVQTLFVSLFFIPLIADLQQKPVKEAAIYAKSNGLQVEAFKIDTPSFSFYAEQITPTSTSLDPGSVVLTRIDKLNELNETTGDLRYETLFEAQGVLLIKLIH